MAVPHGSQLHGIWCVLSQRERIQIKRSADKRIGMLTLADRAARRRLTLWEWTGHRMRRARRSVSGRIQVTFAVGVDLFRLVGVGLAHSVPLTQP
jgi:hypothetical protein